MRPLFASLFALSTAIAGFSVLGGCGDSTTDATGGGGSGTGGGGEGLSNPGRICIDNARGWALEDISGIHLKFRVLDVNGDPIRPLVTGPNGEGDVVILNDENGLPFGGDNEGKAAIALDDPSQVEIYSVLALDFSDSIFSRDLVQDVVDGGRAYVEQAIANSEFPHHIAIIKIGRPDAPGTLHLPFTDVQEDPDDVLAALEELRDQENLGTTDLYGAYISGLDLLDAQVSTTETVIERFLVLVTDGEHEAGNGAALREIALARKEDSLSTKITIGIQGNYDGCALEELAGQPSGCQDPLKGCRSGLTCSPEVAPPPSCTQFIPDVEPEAIASVFSDIADRASGIARSNYKAGICTPVALSAATLTIQVNVDGAQDTERFIYDAETFSGQVDQCIAAFDTVLDYNPTEPPDGGGNEGGSGTGGDASGGNGGGGSGGGATGGNGGAGGAP